MRWHICSGLFERSRFVTCPDCGRTCHKGCIGNHSTDMCEKAADNRAHGAIAL